MRLVLLGDPVDHSFSPALHTAALGAAGVPGTYVAVAVDERGLEKAFADLRSGALDGANVTMPHKRSAAGLCDRLDPLADRARAVNTLVRVGSAVIGHNTDVAGIVSVWKKKRLPPDRPVHVLGNGGAAAAALLAVEDRDVVVSSRRPGAAGRLASLVGIAATEVPWGTGVADAVVVNATPLGMANETLPHAVYEGASGLLDMAYGSEATPTVVALRTAGRPVADGTELLVAQAAQAFRLWTGRRADEQAMSDALTAATT